MSFQLIKKKLSFSSLVMKNYRFNDGTCSLFVLLNDEVLDFALINDIKFLIKHKRKKKKKTKRLKEKKNPKLE
jgi:hypothetical protein